MATAGDEPSLGTRAAAGDRALLVGAALLPVAALAPWPSSSRGLTGEISHAWTR